MGLFSKILGSVGFKDNNPNAGYSAMPYLAAIDGMARDTFNPFINQGKNVDQNSPEAFSRALSLYSNRPGSEGAEAGPWGEYERQGKNPQQFLDEIMKSYEPSQGYKFREKRLLGAARNSAASGGFSGTQYDQETQADLTNSLLSGDIDNFLDRVMGIKREGMAGQERMLGGRERGYERIGNRSFEAAKMLADILSGNSTNMAGAAFRGQNEANMGRNQARGNRLNFIGNLFGAGGG